ncbi:MAG: class I SAM-dependent methyltransferase [Acidobacteriaceae bacterium]
MSAPNTVTNRFRHPSGWLGRLTLARMNLSHSRLTDWGLTHITIRPDSTLLDIGCGGGRTLQKLAAAAPQGKVFGIDHSETSVAASRKANARAIARGQVEIVQGSVSQLPWPDATFDLATAIETHFFWPSLPGDVREVFRILKPGGTLILIAEVYRDSGHLSAQLMEKYAPVTGMTLLTADEHRDLLAQAGFSQVRVDTDRAKGWITAFGVRP